MGIEPDLTISTIGQLDALYAGESPEEKKERNLRYARAFEMYGLCLDSYDHELKVQLKELQKKMAAILKNAENLETASDMQSVSADLDSFVSDQ